MNFFCLLNHKNLVGRIFLERFSQLPDTEVVVLTDSVCVVDDLDIYNECNHIPIFVENCVFKKLIKDKLKDNNIFIFNSSFIDEFKKVDLNYSDMVCGELSKLFKIIQTIINILLVEGKKGKFLFVTTNSSIKNLVDFPISPIYDEAIHSLIRSLAKEFKPADLVFHGICIEPIFEMLDKNEIRNYRKKMKVYGLQKGALRIDALWDFIKNLALTDLKLASGNIFYIAEGLDQMNF